MTTVGIHQPEYLPWLGFFKKIMNLDIFLMNGYGIYVWSSFLFTFLVCLFLFLKTKKTLKKLEKDFIKEAQNLSDEQLEDLKRQKVAKEILISHSRN